jgi:hypothetical protein
VKALCSSIEEIVSSVKESPVVELHATEPLIRRRMPFEVKDDPQKRTVYVEGFGEMQHDQLKQLFESVGEVSLFVQCLLSQSRLSSGQTGEHATLPNHEKIQRIRVRRI